MKSSIWDMAKLKAVVKMNPVQNPKTESPKSERRPKLEVPRKSPNSNGSGFGFRISGFGLHVGDVDFCNRL